MSNSEYNYHHYSMIKGRQHWPTRKIKNHIFFSWVCLTLGTTVLQCFLKRYLNKLLPLVKGLISWDSLITGYKGNMGLLNMSDYGYISKKINKIRQSEVADPRPLRSYSDHVLKKRMFLFQDM